MSDLRARLEAAVAREQLRAIDAALADWCLRHGGSRPVALAMALASRAVGDGHAFLPLDDGPPAVPGEEAFCSADEFSTALRDSALIGHPGQSRPLIVDGSRLYLHRYWAYEHRLARGLAGLLGGGVAGVDPAPLLPGRGLFDHAWVAEGETNWQAVAAAVALRHRLTIISGGPGTGKTYTVLRLIRLLLDNAQRAGDPDPLVRLAAPTGKAAARMLESMRAGLAQMPDGEELRQRLPESAATLHRLLGLRRHTTLPRHHRDNPLTADMVIVDEASMVDLPMMAKLVDALPPEGRLVLLGDRYQLASVESGSVLAELCDAAGTNTFSRDQHAALLPLLDADAPPPGAASCELSDHVVTLQTSHRFSPASPIGRFAAAVNAGDADAAIATATAGHPGLHLHAYSAGDVDALVGELAERYGPLLDASTAEKALEVMESFRLLTATRVGPTGSEAINDRVRQELAARHGFDPGRRWFHGRPVIVLHNDYRTGLFNGDTGVCLRSGDGQLRVWFRVEDGLRALLPQAVPEHESVFAMTVHKSQGSEFEHVRLLLPEVDGPVLSRELVYTGITRARRELTVFAPEPVLRAAVSRRIRRASGLAERLR